MVKAVAPVQKKTTEKNIKKETLPKRTVKDIKVAKDTLKVSKTAKSAATKVAAPEKKPVKKPETKNPEIEKVEATEMQDIEQPVAQQIEQPADQPMEESQQAPIEQENIAPQASENAPATKVPQKKSVGKSQVEKKEPIAFADITMKMNAQKNAQKTAQKIASKLNPRNNKTTVKIERENMFLSDRNFKPQPFKAKPLDPRIYSPSACGQHGIPNYKSKKPTKAVSPKLGKRRDAPQTTA